MPSIVDAEQRVANKLIAVGNIYNQENLNLQLGVLEKKKPYTHFTTSHKKIFGSCLLISKASMPDTDSC
jgi:hypothetical protein